MERESAAPHEIEGFNAALPIWFEDKFLGLGPIDHRLVEDFLRWHGETHMNVGCPARRRNKMLQTLRMFFEYLLQREELAVNPAVYVRPARVPQRVRHKKYLTPDETKRLLGAARHRGGDTGPEYVLLLTLLLSGCRPGEACSLTPDALSHRLKGMAVTGKTGPRQAPMPDRLVNVLQEYIKSPFFQRVSAGRTDVPLLRTRSGRPLRTASIYRIFCSLAREAGIGRRVSPYSTRHTFATMAYASGMKYVVTSRALGHKRLQNTETYVDEREYRLRRLAKRHADAMPLASVLQELVNSKAPG